MPRVRLRAPLSELTGGREHVLPGTTVGEVLRALEHDHPAIGGWILDERGQIRRHINVFVNGQAGQEGTAVDPDDQMHVLPAITGG